MFDDPLLTRVGRQLELMERAKSLSGPLQQVLQGIEALMMPDAMFDPATMRRRIRIFATDFAQAILLPGLLPRLQREAPGVVLEIESKGDEGERALQAGCADLALGAGYVSGFEVCVGRMDARRFGEAHLQRCGAQSGTVASTSNDSN